MATTAPRRASKASALRLRQERAAQAAEQKTMPAEVERIVTDFDISRYGATTQAVRPFLREAMTRSTITGLESARKHCRHLTALAVFSDAQGLALTVESVLTTNNIEDYIRRGMKGESADNRAERRRRLLWMARAANPGPTSPARLQSLPYEAVKAPYTPKERGMILRAARTQPTIRKTEQLGAIVALGFGAGADSVDLRDLWVRDITDEGEAGLTVQFHGPRPRIVPVRRVTESLLRAAIAGRRPEELVIGTDPRRRNTAARIVEDAAMYKVPHIEPSRMRTSWLADLMTDPVPLAVILQAAGLKSARTLVDVMPHLEPWRAGKDATADGSQILRGGAR